MSALYIYYRVQPGREQVLAEAIRAMQARLRGAMPGLAASLLQRVELDSGQPTRSPQPTWMEAYHFNGHADQRAWASFHGALARELSTLPEGIDGDRHAEAFSPLPAAPIATSSRKE